MDKPKPGLLYFYYNRSSFIEKDISYLSNSYKVIEFHFSSKKAALFTEFIRQLRFIIRHWKEADILICFFAGYLSLLPSLFSKVARKKCLIMAGGTDCVSFPSIRYGNFARQPLRSITRISFRLTTCIAPVHEKLVFYPYNYDISMPSPQGILAFCRLDKEKIVTIHNGYDPNFFYPGQDKIKNSFLTVAYGIGTPRINSLKGIDLILQVAGEFPECIFNLVGQAGDDFPLPLPDNVKLFPPSSQHQLLKYYQESEYYLQLSLSEGFPNSLSEAMLCGCVPLGSDAGGIPDIIGDPELILWKRDSKQLKELLGKALNRNTQELGIRARKRIIDLYSEEKRSVALQNLIGRLKNQ
jgi:glycosyltransferase involved in cell wall biosynthesis